MAEKEIEITCAKGHLWNIDAEIEQETDESLVATLQCSRCNASASGELQISEHSEEEDD